MIRPRTPVVSGRKPATGRITTIGQEIASSFTDYRACPIRFGKTGTSLLEIPMTRFPNPKQAPMTNTQVPKYQAKGIFLELAHWDLGFDWDLETWSLGF
jgi:hypothetical protein